MKKQFTYLISAIIAVSLVFVSCSEDENGNNYNGYNEEPICPPDCTDECCYTPEPPVGPPENKRVELEPTAITVVNLPSTIDSLNNLRNIYAIDTMFIVFPCRWAGRPASTVTVMVNLTEQLLKGLNGVNYGAEYVEPDAINLYEAIRLERIRIAVGERTIRNTW